MEYRCVATSVEGFIQQLAVAYITHGYWFYVVGKIPSDKTPAAVDAKLIEQYGIAISKWARCRRKKQGLANMQYLRHERFFVLLATKGRHEFFERERAALCDVRRIPIRFAGYSIGCRKGNDGQWHVSVRLAQDRHSGLKALLVESGLRRNRPTMMAELSNSYLPLFAPIRRQSRETWCAMNRARKRASMAVLELEPTALKRRIIRPFAA